MCDVAHVGLSCNSPLTAAAHSRGRHMKVSSSLQALWVGIAIAAPRYKVLDSELLGRHSFSVTAHTRRLPQHNTAFTRIRVPTHAYGIRPAESSQSSLPRLWQKTCAHPSTCQNLAQVWGLGTATPTASSVLPGACLELLHGSSQQGYQNMPGTRAGIARAPPDIELVTVGASEETSQQKGEGHRARSERNRAKCQWPGRERVSWLPV
ncbi:hypothetical protein OH77DRAFT_552639 [Trametes cingulata]|nr:hypothetical protein OH77DRAFT_552639 [Trametes cingulata]